MSARRRRQPRRKPSLLIDHPVRSGQSIVFEKGDVTVVGSVASGAEVIAGGSIHVYGALRGRAIAGLTGNNRARIFCRRLEAELLAIDGVYQTADDMERAAARQAGAGLARRRGDDVGNARLNEKEKRDGQGHGRDIRQGRRRQDDLHRRAGRRAGASRARTWSWSISMSGCAISTW